LGTTLWGSQEQKVAEEEINCGVANREDEAHPWEFQGWDGSEGPGH
jgi:hypothetical protein